VNAERGKIVIRKAVVRVWAKDPAEVAETVRAHLPLHGNYQVTDVKHGEIFIEGEDYAGWTLDKYVIPRLLSGNIRATEMLPVDPAKLNGLMEIDHVVRVHPGGEVTEPGGVWAPEVYVELDEGGQIVTGGVQAMIAMIEDGPEVPGHARWQVMRNYSGQQGGGSLMHPSEYIGGRIAADILAEPGLYVACEVTGLYPTEEAEENDSDDPIGWVILRQREGDE
jgi:hypothetical protein